MRQSFWSSGYKQVQGNFTVVFFYLGTFVTSFGSLLFVMCVPAFFLKSGYLAEIIGVTIGVHRFSGIAATAWFGPSIDRFNARKLVFLTEIIAAGSSIGLIASWYYREIISLYPFMFFVGIRAIAVGMQSSSRSRLIKLISNENQTKEASFVIWLNKVTQGSHIISSIVAIPLVASGNLFMAIAIDGISFLIGGYSAMSLPDLDAEDKRSIKRSNIVKSLTNLVKSHKVVFLQDQLLALAVSGTILLMVKLSGGNSQYVIYFNLLFGACIWLSSIFAHNVVLRSRTSAYWFVMFFGFLLLMYNTDSYWRFVAYLVTYIGYWILYHKYTVEIQTKTPKDLIGATMAARSLAVAFTLSVGELLGGYVSRLFELKVELGIRAGICGLVIIGLLLSKLKTKLD